LPIPVVVASVFCLETVNFAEVTSAVIGAVEATVRHLRRSCWLSEVLEVVAGPRQLDRHHHKDAAIVHSPELPLRRRQELFGGRHYGAIKSRVNVMPLSKDAHRAVVVLVVVMIVYADRPKVELPVEQTRDDGAEISGHG
jgi:hypothetical protein